MREDESIEVKAKREGYGGPESTDMTDQVVVRKNLIFSPCTRKNIMAGDMSISKR